MEPVTFLISLAVLSAGTYLMRFAGVKTGAALAVKGRRRAPAAPAPAAPAPVTDPATAPAADRGGPAADRGGPSASATEGAEPTSRVTTWMDRATVVLIGAVFATTAIFDGQAIADPARLAGVGVGVVAAVLRVPMLVCVLLAMAVSAAVRATGIL